MIHVLCSNEYAANIENPTRWIIIGVAVVMIAISAWGIVHFYSVFTNEENKPESEEKDANVKSARDHKNLAVLLGSTVIIIAIWMISWMVIDICFHQNAGDGVGTFGDKFGAINSLFSGLAFAGLIMTLILQKEELEAQRKELNDQKKEFETQNKTLKQQQFSTTFFQLLGAVQQTIYTFKISTFQGPRIGDDGFKIVLDILMDNIKNEYNFAHQNLGERESITQEKAREIYIQLYHKEFSALGVFFRSYYRLIKYITMSNLDDKEKYQYTSFARAQFSDNVLLVLFYNCTIGYGEEKLKKMVEDWALLKNMPTDKLIFEDMINWIDDDAFHRNNRYGEADEAAKIV